MDAVEKTVQRDQMKIGIGTSSHMDALRDAGAENTLQRLDLTGMVDDLGMRNFIFRPGDVVLLAHPTVLSLPQIKMIGDHGVMFQVIGHAPMACKNDEDRRYLRSLKPKGISAEKVERRGAKATYPQPTAEQVEAIKALWYSDATRKVIVERVGGLMGREVPGHWVRDQMIKATGHARRTPD